MTYLAVDIAKVSTHSVMANVIASGNAVYKSACMLRVISTLHQDSPWLAP